MKRLLQCLLIPAAMIVGLTMISAQPAEGARVRVRGGYPYGPYVARYRAPYYRPFVPVVVPRRVIPVPLYAPPVVIFPRYRCIPPPPVMVPPAHYEVW